MEHKPDKEKWVSDTLASLDGSRRAEPSADLFERAWQRAEKGSLQVVWLSPARIWAAAACLSLLILANLFTCLEVAQTHPAQRKAPMQSFSRDYFSFTEVPEI